MILDEAPNVPIREISRLTGVNTVTLRAWERRYGLLKPARTNKGHRLYSLDDIQRVKAIQSWLVRGVAISKVKAILGDDSGFEFNAAIDSVWMKYVEQMEAALAQLNRRSLENLLNELIALYPVELIADQLLSVVLDGLTKNEEYTKATKLAFLHTVVLEQFYAGQYRQRQVVWGQHLLVIKLKPEESDILPLALNYSLLVHGYQSECLGYIPFTELIFAAEQQKIQGIIFYADSSVNASQSLEQLSRLQEQVNIPVFLAGKAAHLYLNKSITEYKSVFFGETLQSTITMIGEAFSSLSPLYRKG